MKTTMLKFTGCALAAVALLAGCSDGATQARLAALDAKVTNLEGECRELRAQVAFEQKMAKSNDVIVAKVMSAAEKTQNAVGSMGRHLDIVSDATLANKRWIESVTNRASSKVALAK